MAAYTERHIRCGVVCRSTSSSWMVDMSILSRDPDGLGFYYGFRSGDSRQINVRHEMVGESSGEWWVAYVGGERVAFEESKAAAERSAIQWAEEHQVTAPTC